MPQILLENLGTIDYEKAFDYQEYLLKKFVQFKLDHNCYEASQAPSNRLLLCRHPHVYTLGRSGSAENLLLSEQELKNKGITYHSTNRGGDITYHGPGQLVVYPVLDLEQFTKGLKWYMRSLEEVVIRTLKEFALESGRIRGATGVWLDPHLPHKARKICAMGVRCSRWVTIHGLALNINTDLSYFDHIIPCGIADKGVAGMNRELGRHIEEKEVEKIFIAQFSEVFNSEIPILKHEMS